MILWNHPGVDVTGMVARCEKIAGSCEQVNENIDQILPNKLHYY